MKRILATALAASTLLATAAHAQDNTFNQDAVAAMKGGIVIEAPWAVSVKDDQILVFMTIHNGGDESDKIIGISSEIADRAMIAEFEGGPMQDSKELKLLNTPKGEATSLDQDNYHILLSELNEEVESGDTVPLIIQFEETGELEVLVSVAVMQ